MVKWVVQFCFSITATVNSSCNKFNSDKIIFDFISLFLPINTVIVAQLVRASDCGSEGRGFEPRHPPEKLLVVS